MIFFYIILGCMMTEFADAQEKIKFSIRTLDTKDTKEVLLLCNELGFPTTQENLEKRIKLVQKHDHQVLFVATAVSEGVIGWVHAYEAPSLLSDATVEIGGLVVRKKYRRQGIARTLMMRVEQWSRQRAFHEILLATKIDRSDAQAFYRAMGYQWVHTTHFLKKDLK